ncbi:MAG TPA: sensor domain-containing diguanylate cyclase [Thermoleophilaceae bacterium]|nr:sensor domain-containing diguanylate cyclase [Thermoleophilaceae bacterium]
MSPRPLLNRLSGSGVVRGVALLSIWLIVVGGLAGFLARSQANTRAGVDERFEVRAQIASRFVSTYVRDLVDRQRDVAHRRLAHGGVEEDVFARTVADGGYEAAVLLDGRGRLLRVAPAKPELLGSDMTGRYEHLRRAVAGDATVSKVVPSAARGVPVVAFAVPFTAAGGERRVYSVAYDVATTPLGAYLRNAIPVSPNRVYLIDAAGEVIADNGAELTDVRSLDRIDAALAGALVENPKGSYESPDEGTQRYASRRVPGTPWRIAISVPEETVYASIHGTSRWLAWLAVVGFALGSLLAALLFSRLLDSRTRLASANAALDRLSRVDPLTGLHNRRHLEEVLSALVSAGRRHDTSFAVLLIDIDHFKRVNDRYGHRIGDEVLRATAATIDGDLRMEDAVARWGGEEFLVALPGATAECAEAAAERIRAAVAAAEVTAADHDPIRVTVTIGVAIWTGGPFEQLVERADAALYLGKAAGRDRVVVAGEPAIRSGLTAS